MKRSKLPVQASRCLKCTDVRSSGTRAGDSEYAIGPYGALMVLAFFCSGASIFSLLLALWSALRGTSAHVVRGWFVLLTAALFGAGIFTTARAAAA